VFQVVETDGNLVQAVDLLRIAIKKSLEIDGELDIIVNLVLGRHLARRFVIDDLIAVLSMRSMMPETVCLPLSSFPISIAKRLSRSTML